MCSNERGPTAMMGARSQDRIHVKVFLPPLIRIKIDSRSTARPISLPFTILKRLCHSKDNSRNVDQSWRTRLDPSLSATPRPIRLILTPLQSFLCVNRSNEFTFLFSLVLWSIKTYEPPRSSSIIFMELCFGCASNTSLAFALIALLSLLASPYNRMRQRWRGSVFSAFACNVGGVGGHQQCIRQTNEFTKG